MIFPVADLLSFISHKFSLSPGDLVLTGTPAGLNIVHRFGSLHVCCPSPDYDINNEHMICSYSLVMISYLKGVGSVLAGDIITAGLGDLVTVKFPVVA